MPVSPLGPTPGFPEQAGVFYESKNHGGGSPGDPRKGPFRFQEGLVTDPDVPANAVKGAGQGYETGSRPNHNSNVYIKTAAETMSERSHPGSAAWTESPTYLGEFGHGASRTAELKYERADRDGGRYQRVSPTVVRD